MIRAPRLLAVLLLLWASLATAQGTLYRWVDDEGNVHYTDTIPPSQVSKGHTELSNGGIVVKTVPPAKTPEEVEKDKELERLRSEQERLIAQQRAADRVLLRSFRSDDDLIMARDGKLASINVMIQVINNNMRRQQDWLAAMRAEAANLERSGKPVPRHLVDSISKTERSIRDAYAAISAREAQKETIRKKFDEDLKRFRRLRERGGQQAQHADVALRPILHTVVTCEGAAECDRLWERATAYVREQTPSEFQSAGPDLLMSAAPAQETDIRLILTRIGNVEGEGASLFLDLHCPASLRSQKTCRHLDARRIIDGFRVAVERQDSASLAHP